MWACCNVRWKISLSLSILVAYINPQMICLSCLMLLDLTGSFSLNVLMSLIEHSPNVLSVCLCVENGNVSKDSCTFMKLNPFQLIVTSDCNQTRGVLCTYSEQQQLPNRWLTLSLLCFFLSSFYSSLLLQMIEVKCIAVFFHFISHMLFVKSVIILLKMPGPHQSQW